MKRCASPERLDRVFSVLLAAVLILVCLPFWTLPYVPSQDGPAHLNAAAVLAWYHAVPGLQSYFRVRWTAAGNVLAELLCALLLHVVAPENAERLIVTLYLISFPLAVRFALRLVSRYPTLFALASLPLMNNFFLYMGFWDFCYGAVLFFVGLGVYLRVAGRRTLLRFALLSSLSFFMYLAHVAAFAAFTLVTLALSTMEVVGAPRSRTEFWQRWKPLWFASALALPAALAFLPWLMVRQEHAAAAPQSLFTRLRCLFGSTFAAGYGDHETALLVALNLFFGLVFVLAARGRLHQHGFKLTDAFLAASIVFGMLAMVLPDSVRDGSYLIIRVAFFAWLCLLCWIAAQPWKARTAIALGAVWMLLTCLQLGQRYPAYVRWSHLAQEYKSIGLKIPNGAVYQSIDLETKVFRILPTLHMTDVYGAKPAVNLGLYEAMSDHFAIAYRRRPDVQEAEYIVVEAPLDSPRQFKEASSRIADLLTGYTLAATSSTGRLRLYSRAPDSGASAVTR